jgi:YHS domain-containing protein
MKTILPLLALITLTAPALTRADEPKPAPAPAEAPKVKPYPLTTCLVTGKKLDSMGEPYVFTHEGQEIKMCCKPCLKKFEKEPAKYLEKLKTK